MNALRLWQYMKRIINVQFATTPGNYRNKKLEHLRKAYQVINSFLMNQSVEYWLDFGTLLGYHRENDIIPHEIDVDFGLHEKHFDKIWNNRNILPPGFIMYDTSKNHRGPKLYISYKGFDIDLYFYEDKDETMTSYELTKYPSEMNPVNKDLLYPIKKDVFLGQQTFVPSETEKYLVHYYGYIGRDAKRDLNTGLWMKK